MSRIRYGTAVLAVVAFLAAGCGGGESMSDSAGGSVAPVYDAAAPAAPTAQAADDAGRAESEADAGGESRAKAAVTIAPAERSIVYTAELTVEAANVAAAADRAKAVVTGAGGYVAEERGDSSSTRDRSVITFKVPPPRYPDVLAQLGRDLGKRRSVHQNAQDVTEEVADVASRVKSAEATLGQFRTLLSKATKIGEILEIEREIADREAELESLQARQKALAAQTGMATVTLTLLAQPKAKKPKEETSGFLAGLRSGWDAMVTSAKVALTVLGLLLPWLVLGAVAWFAGLAIVRRLRRRTPPAASSAPSSAPGDAQ